MDTLDALIFDFDGVIVDSEPVHLVCFRQVLADNDISLTQEDYYTKYLGFDDHDCFLAVAADNGVTFTEQQVAEMTEAKTVLVQKIFSKSIQPLPGAVEFIAEAASRGVPMAVCSGALREEIKLASQTIGILEHFAEIIAAEDVAHGKPDPEGYRLALSKLCDKTGRTLKAETCVVVEDSPAGIEAAKAAGMKVLAITNSYAAEMLTGADMVADSLVDVAPESLNDLL